MKQKRIIVTNIGLYLYRSNWVVARSMACVSGRPIVGTAGSNPAGGMGVCLVWLVSCQVEVSSSDWSPVQRSPTECGVSECDRKSPIMRRPWPTGGCHGTGKKDSWADRNADWAYLGLTTKGQWESALEYYKCERYIFVLCKTSRGFIHDKALCGPNWHHTGILKLAGKIVRLDYVADICWIIWIFYFGLCGRSESDYVAGLCWIM